MRLVRRLARRPEMMLVKRLCRIILLSELKRLKMNQPRKKRKKMYKVKNEHEDRLPADLQHIRVSERQVNTITG